MNPVGEAREFLKTAERLLMLRDFQGVHEACLRALRADERAADAFFYLAMIAIEHDNPEKTEELLARAIALDPAQARYHAQRGRALVRLRREAEALAAAEQAAALAPADALTLDTIGAVFSHGGLHDRAIAYFERAVALAPEHDRYLHNLGVSQQFTGDLEGARATFERELALTPEGRRPYAALVHLSRQTRERNFIPELTRQFEAAGDANARLQLGHALAKTYDDLGQYGDSLTWLLRAKAAKREEIGDLTAHYQSVFTSARDTFALMPAAEGFGSAAPIFVIGMPRSGTTLVDRILSSHGDIVSLGELATFGRLANEAARALDNGAASDAALMRATASVAVEPLGRAYIEAALPRVGAAARFIDKMPINFLYAGLIHRALPNARIICLRRDPMDVCLANFRQIFNADAAHYWYSYSLDAIGRYYALFDELIAYWRGVLPADRFMEVSYGTIVADLEGEARRMVSFCDLDWDARCLAFHDNDAPVATASSAQVRSPLYTTSIGRWRRYGDALAPLRAALTESGVTLSP